MIIHALDKSPKDKRDLKIGAIYPRVNLKSLPDYFELKTLENKDQKNTDFCGAYSASTLSELQEGVLLEPAYLFAKAKEIEDNYMTYGSNLRNICKAITKYGSIEKKDSPFNIENKTRNELADWSNWPKELDIKAKEHAKKSYAEAVGYADTFDSIKASIWLNRPNTGVLTGALWRDSWTNAPKGITPDQYEENGSGHAYTYIGWKKIEGVEYLIAQLSNGIEIGDQGKFYFKREIVNKENDYGNYLFIDMPLSKAKLLSKIPIKHDLVHKLLDYINAIIKLW